MTYRTGVSPDALWGVAPKAATDEAMITITAYQITTALPSKGSKDSIA
jgi:hypothetical protein